MIRTLVLKHLPGAGKSKKGGSTENVRGGAMEKGRHVKVMEGEIRKDDPVEYFLPSRVGITSRVPEGVMAIEVP